MTNESLAEVADLLRQRNAIDAKLADMMGWPMTSGHLGEWLAERIFDIDLEKSATAKGIDGRFRDGPLRGRSVNVKWYLKREGILDMVVADDPDYYLVLVGPTVPVGSSRGATRPWTIEAVHLFDTLALRARLTEAGVKIGTATSVRAAYWAEAEVYPRASEALVLTDDQRAQLALFRAPEA